jgi:hypothetical protein|tara:strand:- start:10772 stop:11350 length:579 start_codon:yes stop_codon:yes gene_type:complete
MKNLIKILSFFLILSSCVKETIYPPCTTTYPTTQNNGEYVETNFLDGCWVLQSGTMYIQNLDTEESSEVFLFGSGTVNSLRYDGTSLFTIETITRYQTTWCFDFPENIPGSGSFTLDGDSIYPYGLNVTTNNITVTEDVSGNYQLIGGSARPINYEVVNLENKVINIYIQETYENIDGYNCYYFSKLKFQKL